MMKRILSGAMLTVAMVATGCGGSSASDSEVASMKISLVSPPDFGGNSVVICGDRSVDADGKYPCENSFPCKCFDFEADGQVVAEIPDLCPSKDLPTGDWTFSYTLYTGHCTAQGQPTGDALNPLDDWTNPHNFACYDFENPGALRSPNRSIEELEPGCNENKIICTTENAQKTFDFDVCVIESPDCEEQYNGGPDSVISPMCPQPPEPPVLVLDCACVYNQYHGCLCPDGVLGTETIYPYGTPDVPEGCWFAVDFPEAPELLSDIDIMSVPSNGSPRCLLICGEGPVL